MEGEIPIVLGLNSVDNPIINEGRANFIQVYLKQPPSSKPYNIYTGEIKEGIYRMLKTNLRNEDYKNHYRGICKPQYYDYLKPYFRADIKSHEKIFEDFLKEIGKEEFIKKNPIFPYSAEKGYLENNLYRIEGAGEIEVATVIDKNMRELDGMRYYAVKGYSDFFHLYPSIEHFSKILDCFNEPLIFVGSEYFTQEERGFLEGYYEMLETGDNDYPDEDGEEENSKNNLEGDEEHKLPPSEELTLKIPFLY